jgi:hypothetical protein
MGVDVALGTHTVTVFAEGPQLFVRDPARRGFHAISGFQDIGKLVDSVLYVAKSWLVASRPASHANRTNRGSVSVPSGSRRRQSALFPARRRESASGEYQ